MRLAIKPNHTVPGEILGSVRQTESGGGGRVARAEPVMNERRRALELLRRIEREGAFASLLLTNDSGFVRTLVLGVLRAPWMGG